MLSYIFLNNVRTLYYSIDIFVNWNWSSTESVNWNWNWNDTKV